MQEDVENKNYRKLLFGYLPLSFFLLFVAITLVYLTSNLVAHEPRVSLNEWACYGELGDEKSWNEALEGLLLAKKLDPWNADIAYDLGRLYEWKAVGGSAWNASVKSSRQDALQYFKNAADLRPTWAVAWVSYAQSRMLNRNIDQDTFNALSKGFEYGRWQIDIQQKLLWLSIGIWDKLPERLQQQVREQIALLLERDNTIKMVTKIAVRFQWLDELMNIAKGEKNRDYISRVIENDSIKKSLLSQQATEDKFTCQVLS